MDPQNPDNTPDPVPPRPDVRPTAAVPPRTTPSGHDKVWAIVAHLSSFLGVPLLLPLIIYLAMRGESEYIASNAREALNFHISLLIYSLVAGLLVLVLIGFALLAAIYIAGLIFAVIAAIKASEGGCYRYPLTIRLVR